MMPDKTKTDAFQEELNKLLDKYGLGLFVEAIFTDKLGNKHTLPVDQAITAQLRVIELPTKEKTNARTKPRS